MSARDWKKKEKEKKTQLIFFFLTYPAENSFIQSFSFCSQLNTLTFWWQKRERSHISICVWRKSLSSTKKEKWRNKICWKLFSRLYNYIVSNDVRHRQWYSTESRFSTSPAFCSSCFALDGSWNGNFLIFSCFVTCKWYWKHKFVGNVYAKHCNLIIKREKCMQRDSPWVIDDFFLHNFYRACRHRNSQSYAKK